MKPEIRIVQEKTILVNQGYRLGDPKPVEVWRKVRKPRSSPRISA